METRITQFINQAKEFGLDPRDAQIANEYLLHREYGIAFDHVVNQLYEYDLKISAHFFEFMLDIAKKMELPLDGYLDIRSLIVDE